VRSAASAQSRLRPWARASSSAPDFEQVFRDHHQEIYRYCLAIVRNSADAEDALQATMAAALRALETDDRDIALRPWLFRVAHNESISVLRRRREHGVGEELPEVATDSAAEEVDARERLRGLVADLRTLPERQRSALVMRELSGLSYAEIAGALGCAEGAARQVVHEARTALYTLAEGREMRCDQARTALDGGDRRRLRGRKLKAHLAACEPCQDFKRAIEVRERDLRALCPPLPIAAAGGILSAVVGGGGAGSTGAVAAGAGGSGTAAGGAAVGGAAGASSAATVAGTSTVAGGLAGSAAVKGASLAAAALVAIGGAADLTGAIELPGPLHIGGKQAAEEPAGGAAGGGQAAEPGSEAPSAAGRPGSARAKQARARGVEASTRKGANGRARAAGNGKAQPPVGAGGNGRPTEVPAAPGSRGGGPPPAAPTPPAANPAPQPPASPPSGGGGGGAAGPGEAAAPPAGGATPGGAQRPPAELPGGRGPSD
jgi:RNA polymerase sigma factor (sigma-70 family)